MCIILYPVGLINVLLHQTYWKPNEREEYTGIIIILGFLWRIKFLPNDISYLVLVLMLVSLMIIGVTQLVRN